MPTKKIKSSGGNYTSVAAWEAGEANDLTGTGENIGEIYDVYTTQQIIIAGATGTSPADYRHLTTNPAWRHAGKWDASKPTFEFSNVAAGVLHLEEDYAKCSYLQVKNTSGSPSSVIRPNNNGNVVDACILTCSVIAALEDNAGIFVGNPISVKIRNCVMYNSHNGVMASNLALSMEVSNCVTVGCQFGVRAINGVGSNLTLRNHYSGGNQFGNYNEGGGANTGFTFDHCMMDNNESNEVGLTNNIPYDTTNFVNVTPGSEDLHIVSGSQLKGAGADLSSSFTNDIDGGIRSLPWDVGADQFGVDATTGLGRVADDGAVWPLPKFRRQRKKKLQRRLPEWRRPEEIERQQRMIDQYLNELEKPAAPKPARLDKKAARVATPSQLIAIARHAAAADKDRALAEREFKRRRAAAVAVLLMSH